jgi:hypothetical protein
MDPDSDPTTFFNDFKDLIIIKNFLYFSYNLPTDISSSVLKIEFLLTFCVKILCQTFFQSAQHIYAEGKDPDPDPDLRLVDPNPGGPKTCGSCRSGSGSPTLLEVVHVSDLVSEA